MLATENQTVLQEAIRNHQVGATDQAVKLFREVLATDPNNPTALNHLGILCVEQGDRDEAIRLLQRARKRQPSNPHVLNNLGFAYQSSGRIKEAKACFQQAIRHDPSHRDARLNLAEALGILGDKQQAIKCLRKATVQHPRNAQVHARLGALLVDQNQLDDAEAALQISMSLLPDQPDVLNNLGVVRHRKSDMEGAEAAFRQALALNPQLVNAAANLALVRQQQDDVGGALTLRWHNFQRAPEDAIARESFVDLFSQIQINGPEGFESLWTMAHGCLVRDDIDHRRLGWVIAQILRHHPLTRDLVVAASQPDATTLTELIGEQEAHFLTEPTFQLVMERVIVPDLAFEWLLRETRRFLLSLMPTKELTGDMLDGAARLAIQCHYNGFVFAVRPEETQLLDALKQKEHHRLDEIIVLACYVPVDEWATVHPSDLSTPALRLFAKTALIDPLEERHLMTLVPSRMAPTNDVSQAVQAMYQEHPYPRWNHCGTGVRLPVADAMRAVFPEQSFDSLEQIRDPSILVAGCGTGRHLVNTHQRFDQARIVGLDLSARSLAYALRRTRELGIDDIALVQGDILQLTDWNESFDIVECSGVLHHLEDPVAGWSVLRSLLHANGLMKIGLYSAAARRHIEAARTAVSQWDVPLTDAGIRSARIKLLQELDPAVTENLLKFTDFYSLHECRDLLFHVQEHHFSLSAVSILLDELDLRFIGFEHRDRNVLNQFRKQFPLPDALTSLDAWHEFEVSAPDAFASMYQMWLTPRESKQRK